MPASATVRSCTGKSSDLRPTFEALKKLFKPYARKLDVELDTDSVYYLKCRKNTYRGEPISFGAVRINKSYVSFHIFALYCFPEMKKNLSPALRKRMQGKQCFNFTQPEPELFAELAGHVEEGFRRFSKLGSLDEHVKRGKCD